MDLSRAILECECLLTDLEPLARNARGMSRRDHGEQRAASQLKAERAEGRVEGVKAVLRRLQALQAEAEGRRARRAARASVKSAPLPRSSVKSQ